MKYATLGRGKGLDIKMAREKFVQKAKSKRKIKVKFEGEYLTFRFIQDFDRYALVEVFRKFGSHKECFMYHDIAKFKEC